MRGIMTSGNECGRIKMGMVDVRDVAKAHVQAIKVDEAKNKRFLLVSRCAWRREMAECLAAEFNPKGFNINTTEKTDDKVFEYEVRTDQSQNVLGINYIPIEQSWIDMANSLIASGFIQAPAAAQ